MGIRVHYVMGYGLIDVAGHHDPRFDPNGYLNESRVGFTKDGFTQHINQLIETDKDKNFDLVLLQRQHFDKLTLSQHIHYNDDECGLPSVIVFIPPSCSDWLRYDSSIDYYLERINARPDNADVINGTDWCKIMDAPLYPWESYIDIRTGERLKYDTIQGQMWPSITCEVRSNRSEGKDISDERKAKIAETMEVGTYQEAWDTFVPIVPSELREMLKYLKIFKDENTINHLKPMIYCYWS